MLVFLSGVGTLMASIVLKTSSSPNINNVYGYRLKDLRKTKSSGILLKNILQKYYI